MVTRIACLFLFQLLVLLLFGEHFPRSCAQPGFVSIRCCSLGNSIDGITNITWTSDDYLFQSIGRCKNIPLSSTNESARIIEADHQNSSCFSLPVIPGQDYIARATFIHGRLLQSVGGSSFSVSIGASIIDEVTSSADIFDVEGVFVATDNHINICLIGRNWDIGLLTVELRPLNDPIYMGGNSSSVLKLIARVDLGNGDNTVYRYPIDSADRIWQNGPSSGGAKISSSYELSLHGLNSSIPREVLQTAVTDANELTFLHEGLSASYLNYLLILHFLELDDNVQNGERVFDIFVNGKKKYEKFDIIENRKSSNYRVVVFKVQANGVLNISLVKHPHAKYGPICNAYEIFQVISSSGDIVKRNTNFQENNFMGFIREYLAPLRRSSKLYETQPQNEISHVSSGQSNSTSGSDYGTRVVPRPPQRYTYIYLAVGILAGVSVALSLILGMFFMCFYKHVRKRNETAQQVIKNPVFSVASFSEPYEHMAIDPTVKPFTLQYIVNVTGNYKTLIGEGGFGPVYRGMLPNGQEVAVKVRSATSTQGTREFDNEVSLLSTTRHDNLVPLLGYCCENDQQILVYPFMSNGSLQDRLYGEAAKRKVLDWPTRLSIALGAARGLMYLHTFAGRCIIHRDVKSSNILLDHSMCGKVADFGFSKYAPQEGDSTASLEVRGTAGYLDPEYYSTQQLSTKSDVFSFGVVLLEIITGREPLNIHRPRNEWSLVEWAKPFTREGRIDEIVDPTIKGGYHAEAMWRVVETALSCIEPFSTYRPNMVDVVRELEDSLIIENNASEYMRSIESMGGCCSTSFTAAIIDNAAAASAASRKVSVLPTIPSPPIEPSPLYCQIMPAPQPR